MEPEILEKIKADYPWIRFKRGRRFSFRPPQTVMLGPDEPEMVLLMLHEVGHAICRHRDFTMDVERLKMEREAWEKARELAETYKVEFDDEVAERALDTYRDGLERKSRCPGCGLARFQTPDGMWHCPRCEYEI